MKICIIGSGNVASHLAKAFIARGSAIHLFGRNAAELENISAATGAPYSTAEVPAAEIYLIAVSDSAIPAVAELIINEQCLVAHTSGSQTLDILPARFRRGVFYPLQTFSKNKEMEYDKIPFFIEAENKQDVEKLLDLAKIISQNAIETTSAQRKYIHLTAVFACNFTNHLFARAKEISDAQGIPFDYFLPLIDETVAKIHIMDPKKAQTGPAVRGDESVLEQHKTLITGEQHLKIYEILTESIREMYR